MRILVVEPLNHWHWDLDAFFVRALRTIGYVTFVAPEGYLSSCDADFTIDIPSRLYQFKSRLDARVSGIRVLRYIIKNVPLERYDAVVFLSYEIVPMFLCWPKDRNVFAFEHNNISNVSGNVIKKYIFRSMSSNITGIVFQNHIEDFLKFEFGRNALCVPHPYYRKDVDEHGTIQVKERPKGHFRGGQDRIVIASLSGSTSEECNAALRKFATEQCGKIYVVCKGKKEEKTEYYEVRKFFDDYNVLLENCDAVFIGADFRYRVSGVAYEALSYGKPLILKDCEFSRELKRSYPELVYILDDIHEIADLPIDYKQANAEHDRFLIDHSFRAISEQLVRGISQSIKTSRIQLSLQK